MKKFISLLLLSALLFSCSNLLMEEKIKSAKSGAASSRINNSELSNESVFKEIDE